MLITAAPRSTFHMWQGKPHHAHGLDQVALQRAPPVVIAAVGNARPAAATADIVDEDIDAAIGGCRGVDQPSCIGGVSDVAGMSRHCGIDVPQCGFHVAQLGGGARRQHDPATLCEKRLGCRQPDAPARAGNQHDLTGEF